MPATLSISGSSAARPRRAVERVDRHAVAAERASSAVIAGSRRVQSARSSTTPRASKSASTRASASVRALVDLAGHAPGGGEVDEHRPALGAQLRPRARVVQGCQAVPVGGAPGGRRGRGSRQRRQRPRPAPRPAATRRPRRGHARRAIAADAPEPSAHGGEGQRHQHRQQRRGAVDAGLLAQHPDQPDDGGEHRERHQPLEVRHPGAGPRQRARHRGPERWRPGRAAPCPRPSAAKHGQRLRRRQRERQAERRTHEGRGAGRGHHHREHAGERERRAGGARAATPGRSAAREPNSNTPGQVQRRSA